MSASRPSPTTLLERTALAAQEDMEQRSLGRLEASLASLVGEKERELEELGRLRGRIQELRASLDRAERVLRAKEEEISQVFALRVQEERAACLRHIRTERERLASQLASLLGGSHAPDGGQNSDPGGESRW